jgi:hypothetical protein
LTCLGALGRHADRQFICLGRKKLDFGSMEIDWPPVVQLYDFDTFGLRSAVESFTYCVCVFNRPAGRQADKLIILTVKSKY